VKVLVIGSGAREHALVRSLAGDPLVDAVIAAPGNAGIDAVALCRPVDVNDPEAIAALAADLVPDLVVIGPEVPLVAGAADAVRARGIPCFGPSAEAARLEGSKAFAKEVMAAAEVPTALAHLCTEVDEVIDAMRSFGPPYVIKDDGLAAGKGVVVTEDADAALGHAALCLSRPDGRVVVEEYLDGPEVSLFCLTDGRTVVPLAPAQDFKRVGDGDSGPNTGGMGAYSPLPWAPPGLVDEVVARVAQPTVDEMARRGTPFSGVLYCGLALTANGLRVVEFNARFGDPETQVVLARLVTPLAGVLSAAVSGRLAELPKLRWRDTAAVTVVVAAHGYPGTPRTGDPISGLDDATSEQAWVLHAGTRRDDVGEVVSAGGRVLSVVATGKSLDAARKRVYAAVERIDLPGSHFRTDIAAAAAAAVPRPIFS
jgi:phosphoribosylamine--glycine ligase